MRIVVELPSDRNRCGVLRVFDANGNARLGPLAVSGRASDRLAATRGNPSRNPLQRYGDTPLGSFRVRQILLSGEGTALPGSEFGYVGVILIEATAGDAALAEANGRFRLLIQGGNLSPAGRLRSTAGSLRLSDDDMGRLIDELGVSRGVSCMIVADEGLQTDTFVDIDWQCEASDPPVVGNTVAVLKDIVSDVTRRDALRVSAGGAVALNLAVSFVALGVPGRAHGSPVRMAYNAPPQNTTTYGPGDERTTGGEPSPIQGGGQPITGAGVTQGAPDTPPPPNPTPSNPQPSYQPTYTSPSYAPSPSTSPTPPAISSPAPSPAPYNPPRYNNPSPGPSVSSGTLALYNRTNANLSFTSTVALGANSGSVMVNGTCTSTQAQGSYSVTATRLDNNKSVTKTIYVPAGGQGAWSVTDADFQ